eukprot:Clim_evm11s21 gene=Clim_evmTU11s21
MGKTDDGQGPQPARFQDLNLDVRILKATKALGWKQANAVQVETIKAVADGYDVLARSRTGSGKTAAYAIPIVSKVLEARKREDADDSIVAMVLVPSRELAHQVSAAIDQIASHAKGVQVMTLSGEVPMNALRPLFMSQKPNVLVGTPGRVLELLKVSELGSLCNLHGSLSIVVYDEADLLFSMGHEDAVRNLLAKHIPPGVQNVLMSATLTTDVDALRDLVMQNPKIVDVPDGADGIGTSADAKQLRHYLLRCQPKDKYLVLYALLKLGLVEGRTLIFTNDLDRCYRLKLFLEQFGIKSCVLNGELPIQSRLNIVEGFNRGMYDYIIATDEQDQAGDRIDEGEQGNDAGLTQDDDAATGDKRTAPEEDGGDNKPAKKKQKGKQRKKSKTVGKDFTISRGIDFRTLVNVINFDLPKTSRQYVHRSGRTARGNRKGNALSLYTYEDEKMIEETKKYMATLDSYSTPEDIFNPFEFDIGQVERLRYRCNDAQRMITGAAVKEARLREIKNEILNSAKLKEYFEENPRDREVLRHDKTLQPKRVKEHLKSMPSYLLPESLKSHVQSSNPEAVVRLTGKDLGNDGPDPRRLLTRGKKHRRGGSRGRGGHGRGRSGNPLKNFKI